jgi:RNase P protein component
MKLPRIRKVLSAPGLLNVARGCFQQIPETCVGVPIYPLANVLMSVMAMFGLKCESMLKYDEQRQTEAFKNNLNNLYGVPASPCDTQIRDRLDPVNPENLRPAFKAVHQVLQQQGGLRDYVFMDGHYLLAIDGSGTYSSNVIHCDKCSTKNKSGEKTEYYHQILSAQITHPDKSTVLPLCPEAITREDGSAKNDCERNAAKRLLQKIKADHPQMKFIFVEDGLFGNGPHIEQLLALGYSFIIVVKQSDHTALFNAVQKQIQKQKTEEFETVDTDGTIRGYRFINGVPLNNTYPHLLVNYLDFWEINDGEEQNWIWITCIPLNRETVLLVEKGGRARWKIENEGFNTLKNHGYNLEKNYGHGKQYLATVFVFLMILMFLIDQIEELSCSMFQMARKQFKSRTSLWDKMRGLFFDCLIDSWEMLWMVIIANIPGRFTVVGFLDTS